MELKVLIYIIIAIIYLVSRALKKAQKETPKDIGQHTPDREVVYETSKPAGQPKQMTFEELLKEITEAKSQKTVAEPKQEARPFTNYRDEVEKEEEKSLETVNQTYAERNRYYREYEEGKRQAFERKSLEETMTLADTKIQFGKFKVFEKDDRQNMLDKYLAEFQDPEGFKKAVVMSEILNRKF
jgi:glutamate synthase domain-containing protein 2